MLPRTTVRIKRDKKEKEEKETIDNNREIQ
jgi:hypothetical protein